MCGWWRTIPTKRKSPSVRQVRQDLGLQNRSPFGPRFPLRHLAFTMQAVIRRVSAVPTLLVSKPSAPLATASTVVWLMDCRNVVIGSSHASDSVSVVLLWRDARDFEIPIRPPSRAVLPSHRRLGK